MAEQAITDCSSINEIEYMALSAACQEAIWMLARDIEPS